MLVLQCFIFPLWAWLFNLNRGKLYIRDNLDLKGPFFFERDHYQNLYMYIFDGGHIFLITMGVMTLDCYVFSFFENLLKRPFQVNLWVDWESLHPNHFLGNFHAEWFLHIVLDGLAIFAFAGSRVTMPYAEIGASSQQ